MPPATETPVQEKPNAAAAPVKPETTEKPRVRFEKPKPLSAIIAEKKPEVTKSETPPAKPAAEKAPEATAKAKETAQEPPKASGDTETTPKEKEGSVRASLAKGEAVEEVKPAVTPAETEDDDNDPTLTEKMRKRVNRLKGETAKEREARDAAEKKSKDLEARLAELDAKPKITEAQQKEWEKKEEELMRLRRRYSLESDPEVKKFDTRIEAARKTIDTTVEKADGIPDFVRTFIKDAGGMETFLRSGKSYKIKVGEEDKSLTGAQIFKHLIPHMDPLDVGTIQTSIAEQSRIQAEKSAFIEEESKKAKEYFDGQAKQDEEAKKQADAAQKQQAAMFTKVAETIGKEKFMQDEEVPTTGDEDEINTIKSRNTLRKALRKLVDETISFKPSTPEEAEKFYTDIVRDGAKLYYAEHELKQATKRIKKLEAELDAIKGASRTTPRGTNGASAPAASNGPKVPPRLNGESNLKYGMRLIEAGVPEADRLAALRAG
jgi:hypothetical protein